MDVSPQPIFEYLASSSASPLSPGEDSMRVNLFQSGAVDSVGVLELVLFLEERFEVRFGPEDLESDDFQTIEGILSLVRRRKAA